MCLPSGNDASYQLAEYFGHMLYDLKQKEKKKYPAKKCMAPVDYFMQIGNGILKDQLGLKNTYYASPHGLSNNLNKTTAYDMSIILMNGMKDPLLQKVCTSLDYKCRSRTNGMTTDENL